MTKSNKELTPVLPLTAIDALSDMNINKIIVGINQYFVSINISRITVLRIFLEKLLLHSDKRKMKYVTEAFS